MDESESESWGEADTVCPHYCKLRNIHSEQMFLKKILKNDILQIVPNLLGYKGTMFTSQISNKKGTPFASYFSMQVGNLKYNTVDSDEDIENFYYKEKLDIRNRSTRLG